MLLGVDLGTSHTVAMLRRPDGRTRPLLFDGRPLLPSAGYLDTTGRLHVGPDALRLGHADPSRLEPHPKRHIDEETVLLGDAEVPVADLLAALLGAVAREAVATAGFLPPAVLTYPAGWGAPRQEVLAGALARAGWPRDTRLVPEPVAAARYFADILRRPVPMGSSLAVFDFGGGTLDVAVARNDGPAFTVTASGGDDNLGGLDLDAALVDYLGKSLSGGEPQVWRALTAPSTLAQWRSRREFWENVRGAKEMLSRSSFAPVPVPGVEQAVHLTRDELEAGADPLLRRAVAETRSVIAAAGIAPTDLAGLFLVGGSSRVPMVARLLHSTLGIAPTVIEQPEFPVAEGATLIDTAPAALPGGSTSGTPSHRPQSAASSTNQPHVPIAEPAAHPPEPGATATNQPHVPGAEPAAAQAGALQTATRSANQLHSSEPGPSAADRRGATHFAPGTATAATPTPTPATVPNVPPPITDTRADSAPITPTMPGGAAEIPAARSAPEPPSDPRMGAPSAQAGSSFPRNTPASETRAGTPAPQRMPASDDRAGGPPVDQSSAASVPGSGGRHPASGPPESPGGSPAGPTDDRVYAEPVDPWATGEAAAIAAGGHGIFPSSPAAYHDSNTPGAPRSPAAFSAAHRQHGSEAGSDHGPAHRPPPAQDDGPSDADGRPGGGGSRRRAYVLMAGALAALLLVGGFSIWHFWPGNRGLDYQTLGVVGRVPAIVPVSSSFADAEIRGDRIYLASSDNQRIGVIATDNGAGKPAWRSTDAGQAERWESMIALPDGVALLSASDANSQRRVAVLKAKDGTPAWSRQIDSSDDLYFVGDMAVLADDTGHQLIGLKQSDGTVTWQLPNPKTDYGTSTSLFVATTEADLNGPATVKGRPLDADPDDDTRIVQVSSDRSARVIDAENGKVVTQAPGVAATDDEVVAHDGRLIVRQSEGTQRIASYDLGKLGEPKVLYTAQNKDGHLSHLSPCGDRVCFVEDTDYDNKTDTVTAVDPGKGGRVWKTALADVDGLVPVGSDLLVDNSSQTTLLDKAGRTVWTSGGEAARLDGGNLIEFAKPLSSIADDPAVAGQHLGDQPVQLGPLNDVRSDTCSWNKTVIACAADKDFVILKFAT